MTTLATAEELRARLAADGFCAAGPLVPADVLADAHRLGAELLAGESEASLLALRSLGSLISVFRHPGFAPLICAPSLLSLAAQLGPDPRFSAGYFLSKPPGSPATFWHQDWGFWGDPSSYEPALAEVGVLIYLVDVDEHNGCPRFLPGTHRVRHPLHALLAGADLAGLRRAAGPAEAFDEPPGAVAVPVRAGEAVLFDPRVLHGALPNRSSAPRPALVLWYFTDYRALDPSVQAFLADGDPTASWPADARSRLAPLLPSAPAPGVARAPLIKHPDERLLPAR